MQGFGDPNGDFFPSAIHDMVDQAAYTIAAVDRLATGNSSLEPYALSYWAVSDVFEEVRAHRGHGQTSACGGGVEAVRGRPCWKQDMRRHLGLAVDAFPTTMSCRSSMDSATVSQG